MFAEGVSLPEDLMDRDLFAEQLNEIYGEHTAAAIVALLLKDRTRCYWQNPLKPGATYTAGEAVAGLDGVRQVPYDVPLSSHPEAGRGQIYLQNPASLFAVQVLDPQVGEEILDLAAAPGGKTLAIAAKMKNSGRIAAVEVVPGRFHRLRANLERCGVTNVAFYLKDGRSVGRAVPERFDRVLLDAPCSSQARMRWDNPATYTHWSARKVKESQRKQKSLLRSAYAALKPGGLLVYSTCSFSVEENELVVNHLLQRSEAQLLAISTIAKNFQPGLNAWQGRALHPDLHHSVRIIPDGIWDGFYLALIRKPL
ncbi:MAG: RsmB/NOP family class I SAM-dependent RNA methyltransferase [bacterium]